MKHILKFILESKSTAETQFEVIKSLHELGLVDDSELKVYTYIASGSTGDLDLRDTPIAELPAGLRVGGNLDLRGTPIAKKYSSVKLKKMFPGVKGNIII